MGTWDLGAFDNDDAADWLYELTETSDLSVIAAAFDAVAEVGAEYLEVTEAANAVAAAEMVAALSGQPGPSLPVSAAAWVGENRDADVSGLLPAARQAVARVRSGSELKDLWEETEHAGKWQDLMNGLAARLDGIRS